MKLLGLSPGNTGNENLKIIQYTEKENQHNM